MTDIEAQISAPVRQDAGIKIVASNSRAATGCLSPGNPVPGVPVVGDTVGTPTAALPYAPVNGVLHSWATHVQGAAGTPADVTETESLDAPLTANELTALQQQCQAASFLGTGAGICTCGPAPASFFGSGEVPNQ